MTRISTASGAGERRRRLVDKATLECAMRAAPDDLTLRTAYLSLLRRLSAGHTGISFALFPEPAHPIYFRCGSNDLACLVDIFENGAYGIDMLASPARILDLGAHVGYAAIYLAHRFPTADILCVEPMSENFRLLLMNTLPYRQITARNCAVWRNATRLSGRKRLGDFDVELTEDDGDQDRSLQAFGIADLLHLGGWPNADLIKCSISGSEAVVFADPTASWLNRLDALIVELGNDASVAVACTLATCFDLKCFTHRKAGGKRIFERKPAFRALVSPEPAEIWLINPLPNVLPMFLQDVSPMPWSFFVFDGHSCQLHPNNPGDGPPARAMFPRWFAGHARLVGAIRHAGELSPPVRFLISIETEDGAIVAQRSFVLAESQAENFLVEFPALHGLHRVVLQTDMAAGQTVNANAWARWINLRIC